MHEHATHRGAIRWLVTAALALASCSGESEQQPAPKKVERGDVERIPAPHHSPQEMKEAPVKVRKVTASGTMEADIKGERRHFSFLPAGVNMAVHNDDTGISRVTLTGSEDESGYPKLTIRLENVKLDEVKLPATFTAAPKNDKAPRVEMKLYRDDTRFWEASGEGGTEPEASVTLTEREGKTVRGTFEATLHPRIEDLGEPVQLQNGTFAIELKHLGVSPATQEAAP